MAFDCTTDRLAFFGVCVLRGGCALALPWPCLDPSPLHAAPRHSISLQPTPLYPSPLLHTLYHLDAIHTAKRATGTQSIGKAKSGPDPFMLHPHAKARHGQRWDLVTVLIITYSAFAIPFDVSFTASLERPVWFEVFTTLWPVHHGGTTVTT